MSKVKKMSQAEAIALSQKLSNYFAVHPLLLPYVAPSIAQNPFCWIEMPVSEKVCNDIACGFAIKRPILGREYEIIHSGSKVELLLVKKLISHLSRCAAVRFFKDKSGRLFLCTDADKTTIGSALHNAGKELFSSHIPFCVAEITE